MSFDTPHLESPTSVAPGQAFAPALSIYVPTDAVLTVAATQIEIAIGVTTLIFPFVGKTLTELASQISTANPSVDCCALNRSDPLKSGQLYDSGETTPDGGKVIRIYGLVVRYDEESKIHLLPPYPDQRSLPWYPVVNRGSVAVELHGVRWVFSIPEYHAQEWSSTFGFPFVDIFSEKPVMRSTKVLQVSRTPVLWHRRNLSLIVNGTNIGAGIVRDVDIHNGLVFLTTELSSSDRVLVNYTYREDHLVYKKVNLNPAFDQNPVIIDQSVLIYLVPQKSTLGHDRETTVRHIVARTLTGALSQLPTDEPTLVIGAYQTRPTGVITDVRLTDTRTRGGGIKDGHWQKAVERNREMFSVSEDGRFDGVPFPGATAGVLAIPKATLDSLGLEFVEEQTRRHLAAGGYLLIDPY